ncbi:VOC family protein [Afifella sp. IM 167]|uniref:VOC family protein n=1 Tax=Afifella sp. IM 167 TaxID=2033586 RepID=UPI001CCDAF71|nr:VOC family protein [Afifella sp. IM 167]MBZ8135373.1 glyoxalase [Afifella sp. IM 167]
MSNSETARNAAEWFEMAVTDLDRSAAFFGEVLGTPLSRMTMGGEDIAVFAHDGGMGGNLYQAPEVGAGSPVIHLNAPSPLEEALERVKAHGGAVASEIQTIPEGRFAYCTDPDGTRFGLFAR